MALGELVIKEILVGFAFAFAVRPCSPRWPLAGSLLDTLIGFGFGAVVDPITGTQAVCSPSSTR